MSDEPLATYLHDHLSGATAGVTILQALREPLDRFAVEMLAEVESDRIALQELVEKLGMASSTPKEALAWVGAKVSGLKLGQRVAAEFGVFESLEALAIGIQGKQAMWRALQAASVADSRLRHLDFARLMTRAQSQYTRVEEFRMKYAASALLPNRG